MCNLKQMYSSAKDISHNLSGKASTGLAAVVLGVGLAGPVNADDNLPLQPGAPHTLTYKDDSGKDVTVPDLTGKWKTTYHRWDEIVGITQKKNEFEGIKLIGGGAVGKGQLTVSGKIDKYDVICNTHWSGGEITSYKSKLSKNLNQFECWAEENRVFKRMNKD